MKKKHIIFFCLLAMLSPSPLFLQKGSASAKTTAKQSLEIPLAVMRLKQATGNSATFKDSRDNRMYRQIKVGNQTWMAENLNYGKLVLNMEQADNRTAEKSYYNNDSLLGKKMGALYTWEEATNYQFKKGNVLQGLCPDGWHIPSDKEWSTLCSFLDAEVSGTAEGWSGQNIALLLVDTQGKPLNFGLRFGGNSVSNWFFYLNEMAYFWTADSYSTASAWYRSLSAQSKQIYRGPGDIKLGMSIRCVKD